MLECDGAGGGGYAVRMFGITPHRLSFPAVPARIALDPKSSGMTDLSPVGLPRNTFPVDITPRFAKTSESPALDCLLGPNSRVGKRMHQLINPPCGIRIM